MKKLQLFSIALILLLPPLIINQNYNKKFLPKTFLKIGNEKINIGNLSIEEAKNKCENYNFNEIIFFNFHNQNIASSSNSLQIQPNCSTLDEIKLENKFSEKIKHLVREKEKIIQINLQINEEKTKKILNLANQKIFQKANEALFFKKNKKLYLKNGIDGREIAINSNLEKIQKSINENIYSIELILNESRQKLSQKEKEEALILLKKINKQEFSLMGKDNEIIPISPEEVINVYSPIHRINNNQFKKLSNKIAEKINKKGNNAIFEYNPITKKVESFKPENNTIIFDQNKFEEIVINHFEEIRKTENLEKEVIFKTPIIIQKPNISLQETNQLGIKEEIGFGESYFLHSTQNRIFNVGLAAKQINLKIINPKEEFSFNRAVGEIEKKTGYKKAMVIKNGSTVPGYGGGVCQVSSTLFRTILNAGLPITKRLNHAYRVGYYEQKSKVGMDATVYSGDIDFRFINDTKNPILIYTEMFPEKYYLKIRIFGTSDGRKTEIVNFKKYNYVEPPEPTYIDDPEKPIGYLEQTETAIPGITSKFTNVVKDKNDNIIREDEYVSRYRAWGARYIRGTKP